MPEREGPSMTDPLPRQAAKAGKHQSKAEENGG
jgi:hypothetical protein